MDLTDLTTLRTQGITRDQIFDKWVDAKDLLKQTGLTMKEAEQAESQGMFQRSLLNLDSEFKDSMFTSFSIGQFHEGTEIFPVLSDQNDYETQAQHEKVQREQEAFEKEQANNAKIVELNQCMIDLDKLKAQYVL